MKKIITCAGYGATGSSAITDYLKEFEDIYCIQEFEFRFLQDPYGIRDLEYALLENNHRLNTSFYIKKFIEYINFLSKSKVYSYEKYFKGSFKKLSLEYIKNLGILEWNGYWHQDIIESNFFKRNIYYLQRVIQKYILQKKEGGGSFIKCKMYYSYPKTIFHECTKKYLESLFEKITEGMDYNIIALDQLLPPDNLKKYLNYFYNIKVVVVDRDPRDIYLLNQEIWKEKWIPSQDLELFIKWFKEIRRNKEKNSKNVLNINFEDLIYKYEETSEILDKFLELNKEKHIKKKKYFNPEISIKNTKIWEKYKKYEKNIKKIEKELKQYCYNHENI